MKFSYEHSSSGFQNPEVFKYILRLKFCYFFLSQKHSISFLFYLSWEVMKLSSFRNNWTAIWYRVLVMKKECFRVCLQDKSRKQVLLMHFEPIYTLLSPLWSGSKFNCFNASPNLKSVKTLLQDYELIVRYSFAHSATLVGTDNRFRNLETLTNEPVRPKANRMIVPCEFTKTLLLAWRPRCIDCRVDALTILWD